MDQNNHKQHFKIWNRRRWLLLVFHNFTAANGFENETEALYSQNPDKYSILSELNDALKYNGKFEFHLEYKDYIIHWAQNDNPLKLNETLYDKAPGLHIYRNKTNGNKFSGLVRQVYKIAGCNNSLLDGNSKSGGWYYAVCMYRNAETNWRDKGIPGANGLEKFMSLWVRVPIITKSISREVNPMFFFFIITLCS